MTLKKSILKLESCLGLTTVGSTVKKKYTTRHCAPVNIEYALAEPTDTMHHLGAR